MLPILMWTAVIIGCMLIFPVICDFVKANMGPLLVIFGVLVGVHFLMPETVNTQSALQTAKVAPQTIHYVLQSAHDEEAQLHNAYQDFLK
jgi:hypothetical protein